MTDAFIRAAQEKGHNVTRFDAAFRKVGGCRACETCYRTGKACSFDDDFNEIAPAILAADALVFTMPVYWYSIPAQIKGVIDRIYSMVVGGKDISGKECALIACCEEDDLAVLDGVRAYAILIVMGFHLWQQSWLQNLIPHDLLQPFGVRDFSLTWVPRTGYMFVDVLLLLSGFCLFLPYARQMADPLAREPDAPGLFSEARGAHPARRGPSASRYRMGSLRVPAHVFRRVHHSHGVCCFRGDVLGDAIGCVALGSAGAAPRRGILDGPSRIHGAAGRGEGVEHRRRAFVRVRAYCRGGVHDLRGLCVQRGNARPGALIENASSLAPIGFVGIFYGAAFLVTAAAILALQQLSGAADARQAFETLRELGCERAMARASLRAQVRLCFAAPLAGALIHDVFGLVLVAFLALVLGSASFALVVAGVLGFTVAIMGAYYLITCRACERLLL